MKVRKLFTTVMSNLLKYLKEQLGVVLYVKDHKIKLTKNMKKDF